MILFAKWYCNKINIIQKTDNFLILQVKNVWFNSDIEFEKYYKKNDIIRGTYSRTICTECNKKVGSSWGLVLLSFLHWTKIYLILFEHLKYKIIQLCFVFIKYDQYYTLQSEYWPKISHASHKTIYNCSLCYAKRLFLFFNSMSFCKVKKKSTETNNLSLFYKHWKCIEYYTRNWKDIL